MHRYVLYVLGAPIERRLAQFLISSSRENAGLHMDIQRCYSLKVFFSGQDLLAFVLLHCKSRRDYLSQTSCIRWCDNKGLAQ